MTFKEFVCYLLKANKLGGHDSFTKNGHWLSYHESCHPCHMRFDFIGKFETLMEDAAYVLAKVGGGVDFPDSDPDNSWNRSREYVNEIRNSLSKEEYQQLLEMYALDYASFDYK